MSRVSVYLSEGMYWEDFTDQKFRAYDNFKTAWVDVVYNARLRWKRLQRDIPRLAGDQKHGSYLYAAILRSEMREAGLLKDF
jgi:hypothetical protein